MPVVLQESNQEVLGVSQQVEKRVVDLGDKESPVAIAVYVVLEVRAADEITVQMVVLTKGRLSSSLTS